MSPIALVGLILLTAVVYVLLPIALEQFVRLRGRHRVVCPEAGTGAVIEVGAGRAALLATLGRDDFPVTCCERWPERTGCGQGCLDEVRMAAKRGRRAAQA